MNYHSLLMCLRNIYIKEEVEEIGLEYIGVGLAQKINKKELDKAIRDVVVADCRNRKVFLFSFL